MIFSLSSCPWFTCSQTLFGNQGERSETMTESDWLNCTDPQKILECIRDKTSERKLRLTLCGWSRLNWKWLSQQSQSAVEVAELFADGLVSDEDRRSADVELWWGEQGQHKTVENWLARLTLEGSIDLWEAAYASSSINPKIKNRQVAILRDIVGNPFHPVFINPSWLTWNDGTVFRMARSIYNERSLDGLPILADALVESGCTDQDILIHCRGTGPHVRGCWVLDLILGNK